MVPSHGDPRVTVSGADLDGNQPRFRLEGELALARSDRLDEVGRYRKYGGDYDGNSDGRTTKAEWIWFIRYER